MHSYTYQFTVTPKKKSITHFWFLSVRVVRSHFTPKHTHTPQIHTSHTLVQLTHSPYILSQHASYRQTSTQHSLTYFDIRDRITNYYSTILFKYRKNFFLLCNPNFYVIFFKITCYIIIFIIIGH